MKKKCCKLACCLLVTFSLLIVGGVMLGIYLPEEQRKQLASTLIDAREPTFVFNKCESNTTECCNGLSTICDMRVDKVLFAGMHNAMATREDGFLIVPNHDLTMEKALTAGYRFINLDVGSCQGKLVFMHGRCHLGQLDPIETLSKIVAFLDRHPTEIIVLNLQGVQNEAENEYLDLEEVATVLRRTPGFQDKLYVHKQRLQNWPALRELRDTGKQIILFHYKIGEDICFRDGCPDGFHDWFLYAEETPFQFGSIADVEDTESSCLVTRGSARVVFYALNLFLTVPNRAASTTLNSVEFLQTHIPACMEENFQREPNVVLVDFWSRGDLPLYVQRQNAARARQALSESDKKKKGQQ